MTTSSQFEHLRRLFETAQKDPTQGPPVIDTLNSEWGFKSKCPGEDNLYLVGNRDDKTDFIFPNGLPDSDDSISALTINRKERRTLVKLMKYFARGKTLDRDQLHGNWCIAITVPLSLLTMGIAIYAAIKTGDKNYMLVGGVGAALPHVFSGGGPGDFICQRDPKDWFNLLDYTKRLRSSDVPYDFSIVQEMLEARVTSK